MKTITVRKKKQHRILILFFACFLYCFSLGLVIISRQILYSIVVLPCVIIASALAFYYESWKITFSADIITFTVFQKNRDILSYSQIADAVIDHYSSEKCKMIVIYFSNGRKLRIREDDDNANKALRIINLHHSIQG